MNVVSIIDDWLFDVVDADVGDFVVDTVAVLTPMFLDFMAFLALWVITWLTKTSRRT